MPEQDDARQPAPAEQALDLTRPSGSRLYDLFLGGKNNFEVERRLFQDLVKLAPDAPDLARENRRWLTEVVGRMITEGGIHQFLDLGAGLPDRQNLHEVALKADPNVTFVYVDNDLTAISHGQALLADDNHSFFTAGDLTEPAAVLSDPIVKATIHLDQPVGIILGLVLHGVPDTEQVGRIVAEYVASVPSGSYVALSHVVNPHDGSRTADFADAVEAKLREAFPNVRFRTRDEVAGFLTGLEPVEPGLVDLTAWWSTDDQKLRPTGVAQLLVVALARKP